MSAPGITDMDVENRAVQIDKLPTLAACELRLSITAPYSSGHMWCEPVNANTPYPNQLPINRGS